MSENAVIREENILNSVKKLLGIMPDITAFDQELIIHINAVFTILHQEGIGPDEGFAISSGEETWSDYFGEDLSENLYNSVKTLVYMRVKMIFDPPTNSALLDSFNKVINELEYRLYTESGGY